MLSNQVSSVRTGVGAGSICSQSVQHSDTKGVTLLISIGVVYRESTDIYTHSGLLKKRGDGVQEEDWLAGDELGL